MVYYVVVVAYALRAVYVRIHCQIQVPEDLPVFSSGIFVVLAYIYVFDLF